ncbi:uncharacterized protein LOC124352953 [Homalodisca vitripennis]|uniref:uncharacterized protein LOC124352953 n=1 Tax=Homalodisca vitripennis TaxID=197043 RepID=UPI001EEC8206|nr:uncharacterized protein LOC124352953 [Homalodisca vitripennis]
MFLHKRWGYVVIRLDARVCSCACERSHWRRDDVGQSVDLNTASGNTEDEFCTIVVGVRGVQITQLFVPEEVRNGTNEAAILDCEYTLTPADLTATSGLVVKWFFNNGPAPVYQWIPGQRPQDLGILKGRLRLDYRASSHESTMHRALYILQPTTELSGEYKCSVSTFTDEDFMIGKMVVIAPEKHLYLLQSRTALERVNITCRAVGVFPEPKMALFREDVITGDSVQLPARVETIPQEYHYDIEATTTLQDDYLDTPTVFYCDLYIANKSCIWLIMVNIVYMIQCSTTSESRDDTAGIPLRY